MDNVQCCDFNGFTTEIQRQNFQILFSVLNWSYVLMDAQKRKFIITKKASDILKTILTCSLHCEKVSVLRNGILNCGFRVKGCNNMILLSYLGPKKTKKPQMVLSDFAVILFCEKRCILETRL